jgi:hypothetical protein
VLVAALSIAVLSLAILLWSTRAGGGPVQNPGLRLELVGFTNIQGAWCADLVVTNPTRNLHFVEAWRGDAKYWGEAIGNGKTNELQGIQFSGGPVDVPVAGVVWLRVELPPETERWQVTAKCYRSDLFSRSFLDRSPGKRWIPETLNNLPEPIVDRFAQIFIWPTWRRSFDLSSGFLTNLPPIR